MDLSATSDLTALALWFPPERPDGLHFALVWLFLPEENIEELEQKSRAPYRQWAREGWLILTPGNVVDYKVIRDYVVDLSEHFDVVNWRYDKWSAVPIVTELSEDFSIEMVQFGQGFGWMSPPTRDFERLLTEHKLRHAGNPAMGWMMGNCQFDRDSEDRVKIVKAKKQVRKKVDGPVALVMARDGAMRDAGAGIPLTAADLVVGG